MSIWTETLIIIIPIAYRDKMASIMDTLKSNKVADTRFDTGDDRLFDDIRLSTTGNEPASHLATVCPCTKPMASEFVDLFGMTKLAGYGDGTITQKQKNDMSLALVDPFFFVGIFDRLEVDAQTLRTEKTVKGTFDNKLIVSGVTNPVSIWSALGLTRIEDVV